MNKECIKNVKNLTSHGINNKILPLKGIFDNFIVSTKRRTKMFFNFLKIFKPFLFFENLFMKKSFFCFLFLIFVSLPIFSDTFTGTVEKIYPQENRVYFKISGWTNCSFYIILDQNESDIKKHTSSFYTYPIVLYSKQYGVDININSASFASCINNANLAVNYVTMNF